MTVTSLKNYVAYQGDGIATTFTIPFLIFSANDLLIYLDNTLYTSKEVYFTGLGGAESTITFRNAPVGELLLQRSISLLRETDYQENGDFRADTVNADFDRLYLILQGNNQVFSQSLRVLDAGGVNELPYAQERAGKLLSFDTNGQPLMISANSGSSLQLAQDLANYHQTNLGAALVGFSKANSYAVNTVGYAINQLIKTNEETIKITSSTEKPTDAQGKDGDLWFIYDKE